MGEYFKSNPRKMIGLLIVAVLMVALAAAGVMLGYTRIPWREAVDALIGYDGSREHIVVRHQRIPRTLVGMAVGASLATAGAVMQALTRNPLASPGLFGINAGAAFFIVIAVSFFSFSSLQAFSWIAFFGAAVSAIAVFAAGSLGREGATPLKLILAGAAMTAMFSSLTQGVLVVHEKTLEEVLFWLVGSVQGRSLDLLLPVIPWMIAGWIGALLLAKPLNLLMLGDEVAQSLGMRTGLVKTAAVAVVILLAGGSVAVAGPIGFVGIMVPHLARALFGNDHRWLLPACMVLGASLLVAADIGARFIIMPEEVPVGVMTALVGVPFFIVIARRSVSA
ncbi:FecCD family ABC transporter permease [Staphylospora marina]|uniref:FecCD family ABC transporter permease n=1 Tax=Staphylospora marina TaxID=2490858 RepID=UPI000F5BCAAC|nr:iron ABC transporter permease [Staphylospora marina]